MKMLSRKYSESKIKSDYSKAHWIYDLWAALTESKARKKVLESANIQDASDILEVAVGTGKMFLETVKRNPHGRNEGLDLSPEMLKHARKRLAKVRDHPFNLQVGNAYHLPFEENTFDLLINNYMFDLLPEEDFPKLLAEFKRVLKPSGKAMITSMTFGHRWYHRFWFLLTKLFPRSLTGCRPITLAPYVQASGFQHIQVMFISQNTFPSEIIMAQKAPKH